MSLPSPMSPVRGRLSAPFRVCLFHAACARSRRRSGGVCASSRGSLPRESSAVGDPVRLDAGRPHSGTAEMDSRYLSRSSSGLGHKIFILVDRGSNPLRDAMFSSSSKNKEAQFLKRRSAETGLKDRGAPELVTGDFFWKIGRAGSRHSLAKREPAKAGSGVRISYLPPVVFWAVQPSIFLALAQSGIRASAYEAEGRKFKSFTRGHSIF